MKMVNRRAAGSLQTWKKGFPEGRPLRGEDRRRRLRLEANDRDGGDQPGGAAHAGGDEDKALHRERIEEMAGERGAHREAEDHHHPDRGGGGRAALRRDSRRQHREHRGACRAGAHADEKKCERGERKAGGEIGRSERGGERRADSAERQCGQAAEDPGRSASADVGAIAPGGAQNLDCIMRGDEDSRHESRQCEFNDHHPIDRRCHQNDDGAERGLNKSQPDNAGPSERRRVHRCSYPRMAKALTSMPST